jgi:hypothetical protein
MAGSAAVWAAGLLCVPLPCSSARGTAPSASPAAPLTTNSSAATLEYQETDYTIANLGIPIETQSAPFAREPDLGTGKVLRGQLRFGDGSNAISFIWNETAGKLFLDLNRNRDLTDDLAATFLARTRDRYSQVFANISLPLGTGSAINRRVLVDLDFRNYGGSRPFCSAGLRACWKGRLELNGRSWQVALPASFLSSTRRPESEELLIRPWAERDNPIDLGPGSLVAVPFSQRLFFDGRAYRVEWRDGSQSGEFKPVLQFTEAQVELGNLEIGGRFVERLILEGDAWLVLVDRPGPAVKVPGGEYRRLRAYLKQGGTEATLEWGLAARPRRLVIDPTQTNLLVIGGPLTNAVSVARRGGYLELNYRLLGADGEPYQLTGRDYSHPPEFAVYKGGQRIASDKFQYG